MQTKRRKKPLKFSFAEGTHEAAQKEFSSVLPHFQNIIWWYFSREIIRGTKSCTCVYIHIHTTWSWVNSFQHIYSSCRYTHICTGGFFMCFITQPLHTVFLIFKGLPILFHLYKLFLIFKHFCINRMQHAKRWFWTSRSRWNLILSLLSFLSNQCIRRVWWCPGIHE